MAVPPRKLDVLGRCCGRKPLVYKLPVHRMFCVRCDAEFSPEGQQRANWAWLAEGDGFTPRYPDQEPYRLMVAEVAALQGEA